MHLKKDIKIGEFLCSQFNTEDRKKKKEHFQHIMVYHFKKGKNATEMQKKICAVYREGAVTDQNVSKVVCEISCWRYLAQRCSTIG